MATRTGKVQTSDIKQGKTFFMVRADFPIIDSRTKQVGEGEVSGWVVLRPTGKPYWEGGRLIFQYINSWGNLGKMSVHELNYMNNQVELITNKLYTPVFSSHRSAMRFIKAFEGRKPTKAEVQQAKHRMSLNLEG
jgi:hypothetical protein